MQKPLLEDLRRRHPGARIDVLVNASAVKAARAIDAADEWIAFDREGLQKRAGTAELPILAPVREVEGLMRDLSARDYDLIVNFTHNRLSAHLAAGILAGEKRGLLAEGRGFRALENRWLRHFNERFGWKGATPFHYVELLAGSFGLGAAPAEAKPRGKRVLLQPLTSDPKKNWSLTEWKNLLNELRARAPGFEIAVVGAPFEEEALVRHFETEDLMIAGLGEVRRMLAETALVITGDTSIKHLAVNEGVPVLEIALGSSEPRLTGAYQNGARILSSAVACAPCPPSSTCRKLSHECGESIASEEIAAVAMKMLSGASGRARVIGGEWTATGSFAEAFEKSVWRAFLDGNGIRASSIAAAFVTAALRDGADPAAGEEALELEQRTLAGIHGNVIGALKQAAGLCVAGRFDPASVTDLRRQLSSLAPASSRLRTHTQELAEAGRLPFAHPLAFFGHARRAAEELGERLEIRRRFLTQIHEHLGGAHERFARDLPERGPEAT